MHRPNGYWSKRAGMFFTHGLHNISQNSIYTPIVFYISILHGRKFQVNFSTIDWKVWYQLRSFKSQHKTTISRCRGMSGQKSKQTSPLLHDINPSSLPRSSPSRTQSSNYLLLNSNFLYCNLQISSFPTIQIMQSWPPSSYSISIVSHTLISHPVNFQDSHTPSCAVCCHLGKSRGTIALRQDKIIRWWWWSLFFR